MRWRRTAAAGAVLVTGSVLLAGCARPEFQYADQKPGAAPAGTVYFKVPDGWSSFPTGQITAAQAGWSSDPAAKALLDQTSWQAAYDASIAPSLEHVLGTAAPEQPVVYASLRALYTDEAANATTTSLRDMVVPVSKLGDKVDVVTDEKVSQGGADGVHLVFSYSAGDGAPKQTVDQTAYLSAGKDAVYLLVVRCTTACYDHHRDEIGTVTSSYTIREDRSG